MKVVLAGNPNAGKTTLFNALTHSNLKTGNWHGVTTSPAQKTLDGITYVDVPGMYALDGYTMEEECAKRECEGADIIVNVVDCTTLENSLNLTKTFISLNKRVVVYLTKDKPLSRRGGYVDVQKLQAFLGVPVLLCKPKKLKEMIQSGQINFDVHRQNVPVSAAYFGGESKIKRAEKPFYNKIFAPIFFCFCMVLTFLITFHPAFAGAKLKDLCEDLVCQKLSYLVGGWITNATLRSFICDGIIAGAGGVLAFIPQITILYLSLTLLDESGIMSALSFVTDGVFEKVNLSGRATFSLVSGFGCTAAAIATTRGYSEESARRRTIAVLPYVPCGAKLPVFLTFLSPVFANPFPVICILYFCGLALSVMISAFIKGEKEGLITEITPISMPNLNAVKNKLFFYVKGFIIKVTKFVTLFCAISWVMSNFSFTFKLVDVEHSMLATLSRLVLPLFYPMGISDWRIAYAAVTGFAAKENVAATINLFYPNGLNLGLAPSIAVSVFILACPACISAFAASVKEIGWGKTLKYNLLQLAFAFILAYLTYFILSIL
jgi:ferrous iron transport protein B